MSRPTTSTLHLRVAARRALDQISGALTARLLDQVLAGQREHGNRLRVLAAELADTRSSIHRRFNTQETVMSETRAEFNDALTEIGQGVIAVTDKIAALSDRSDDITDADIAALKSFGTQLRTAAVDSPQIPTEETPAPGEGEPTPAPVEESPAVNDETPAVETFSVNDDRS